MLISFFFGESKEIEKSFISFWFSRYYGGFNGTRTEVLIEETFEIRVDPIFSPMWNKVIMLKYFEKEINI